MKKVFLLLTAFSAGTLLMAQGNFQKAISIPFTSSLSPKSIVQCSDGGFLVGTGSSYMSPSASCLIKTDPTGQVTWTKTITASGYMDLIQAGECPGGGYFVFSDNSDSAWTNSGFAVTKLDASGNVLWSKTYPNTFASYSSSKIRPTTDGGFIVSQSLQSKMGALKLDGNGNILWSTAYSDDPNDQSPKCPSFDCFISNDGSMIFSGKRNNDILLVKTNSSGQMQWSSTLGNGSSYYHANGVSGTADGGYIVCGYDNFYPFAMKVSSTGAVVWYHAFSASMNGGEFSQIKELANGNFIAIGSEYYTNTFIVILDPGGSIISSSAFGNTSSGTLSNASLCVTADGGYAVAGSYNEQSNGLSALAIMKTDANGNFACNFNYYPMTFMTVQPPPYSLSVPIYSFTQPANSSTLSPNLTFMNATEVDFCVLFSTNDPAANAVALSAFPSPVAPGENLHLNVAGAEGLTTISIYDANGRVVKTLTQSLSMSATQIEIPAVDLSPGIYLVRMTGENESTLGTTRFIVR